MNYRLLYIGIELFVFIYIYFLYYEYHEIFTHLCIINMLKVDGILFSCGFICRYFQISRKNPFYDDTSSYRIIYYMIIICFCYTFNIVLWFLYPVIINVIYLIFIFPEIVNYMMKTNEFKIIKDFLDLHLEILFQDLICKYIAKIINLISVNNLNINPKIDFLEIRPYLSFTLKNKTIFFNFINTFLLVSYLNYLESSGYLVSTKLLKRYFGIKSKNSNKNNIYDKESITKRNKRKNYIIGLLQNREWDDLFEPYALYSFIKIYAENTQESFLGKYLKIIWSKIRNAFRRALCLCSFGIIYKHGFLCPIISTIFIRKYRSYGNYYIVFTILSPIIFYITDVGYIFSSFITELLPLILFNKIGKDCIKDISKFITKIVQIYIIDCIIEWDVLIISSLFALISSVSVNKYALVFILLSTTIMNFVTKINLSRIMITITSIICFGYLSSHNVFHCLSFPIIITIYFNIFIIKIKSKKFKKEDLTKSFVATYHDKKQLISKYF
jgi:hypothetical protein